MKKNYYFTLSSFPSSNISLSPYIIITVALLLAEYNVDRFYFSTIIPLTYTGKTIVLSNQ